MLSVEEDALAGRHEEANRLSDHREILLRRDAYDLLDVEHRGLAYKRHDWRNRSGKDLQAFVIFSGAVAATRHPECDDLGVAKWRRCEELEQLGFLWVGGREAGLNHVDTERIEALYDTQLLLRRQAHSAATHSITEGRVVELNRRVH